MAKSKLRVGRPRSKRAFTFVDLLELVAIIALLTSTLPPSGQRARQQARGDVCIGRCRQAGVGLVRDQHISDDPPAHEVRESETRHPLHEAAERGDVPAILATLRRGADVNSRDSRGRTALIVAAGSRRPNAPVFEALLAAGADLEASTTYRKKTALMEAATSGNASGLAALLAAGADVDRRDGDGHTALMWAAKEGDEECVGALLQAGAEFAIQDNLGLTALSYARASRDREKTRLLMAACAERVLRHAAGHKVTGPGLPSELMAAAWAGDSACLAAALKRGADVAETDADGWNALMWAAARPTANQPAVRTLVDAGAAVGAHAPSGLTSLMAACWLGASEHVSALAKLGAPLEAVDEAGWTALMYAASLGDRASVDALLRAGANVQATCNDGLTPLMYAAQTGSVEKVVALANAGAHVDAGDRFGVTALMSACYSGHGQVVERLLAQGADPNTRDRQGRTALFATVLRGDLEQARVLLKAGARTDVAMKDGSTLLMWAAMRPDDAYVRLLLDAGAKAEAEDALGRSALHWAANSGTDTIMDALLQAGVGLESRDNRGRTPLLAACAAGNARAVRALLTRGANQNARDTLGRNVGSYIRDLPEDQRKAIAALVGPEATPGGADDRAVVERDMRLRLPPYVSNVDHYSMGLFAYHHYVRMMLPCNKVEEFLSSDERLPHKVGAPTPDDIRGIAQPPRSDGPTWWQPTRLSDARYGQAAQQTNDDLTVSCEVLVGTEGESTCVMYVHCSVD